MHVYTCMRYAWACTKIEFDDFDNGNLHTCTLIYRGKFLIVIMHTQRVGWTIIVEKHV